MYSAKRKLPLSGIFQFLSLALVLLTVLFLLAITILALLVPVPGSQDTPAGYPHNQALYVTARDGTELAVDIWLPANLAPGEQVPAIVQPYRFWRSAGIQGIGGRILVGMGLERFLTPQTDALLSAGYAVVLMDLRGSGASYGSRPSEFTPRDVDDLADLLDWILLQPWSDGRIGAIGDGLNGSLVEKLVARGNPALQAAVLLFSPFDLYQDLLFPGGISNTQTIKVFEAQKELYDSNSVCAVRGWQGALCRFGRFFLVTGVKPVGGDHDQSQLSSAVSQHTNQDLYERLSYTIYRDDPIDRYAQTFSGISPYVLQKEIAASKVPLLVFASWLDAATADGALHRFLTLDNPQQVLIGAWSHGGANYNDPLIASRMGTDLDQAGQLEIILEFLDSVFMDDKGSQSAVSQIKYDTLGSGSWHTTSTWPPPGAETLQFYLSANRELSPDMPSGENDLDLFSSRDPVSSSHNSRWHSFPNGQAVSYPGGIAWQEGYLTYTSPPLTRAFQIIGNPQIQLFLSSTTLEQNLFVYLEAVDPSGKAAYITEGMLRTRHWKVSVDPPPYNGIGTYHSFLERDRLFFDGGEPEDIHINLFSTAASIPAGYRLRIAISSSDTSLEGSNAAQTAAFTIHRSQETPSSLILPVFYQSPNE